MSTTSDSTRSYQANYQRNRIANESPEAREMRLRNMRERRRAARLRDINIGSVRATTTTLDLRLLARNASFTPEYQNVGSLNNICNHCHARRFTMEKSCCLNGKIHLDNFLPLPEYIQALFSGRDPAMQHQSRNFLQHIRKYNTAFSFTSLGANIESMGSGGPPVFKIQGTIYHNQSSLFSGTSTPSFGQLYLLDPAEANESRLGYQGRSVCLPELMAFWDTFFRQNNRYVQVYRQMGRYHEEAVSRAREQGDGAPVNLKMYIQLRDGLDSRRYNLPTEDQVAIMFEGVDGFVPTHRDIVVHSYHSGNFHVHACNPAIDALQYPIFFPFGENGFNTNIAYVGGTGSRQTLSMAEYIVYRLSIREDRDRNDNQVQQFSALHRGRRLFQQYLVDSFCRVEGIRLDYIRRNQKQIRASSFSGLLDYVGGDDTNLPGRSIILQPSFTGGPRYLQCLYQNAMTIVRSLAKPDLFITFTCNPLWPEIQQSLLDQQTAADRPDIVTRVFHQ